MSVIETDYLVIGAGATALSFVDSLLDQTDAHITIVDRRDRPGGHWNDAYPFVRLHQPSSFYGVASTPLGSDQIDTDGPNAGFFELATGPEITDYFHRVMKDRLLPSGRVRYMPMTEHTGNGELRSTLSGKTQRIDINRRIVDASLCENGIPLTHTRKFTVAEDVACIPPNFLPRIASQHRHFTVLGAGKTAMDSVLWLMENGADPDQVTWVVPRDPWMINRASTQPSGEFFHQSVGGAVDQLDAMAHGTSFDDIADRMEAKGRWLRLFPDVRPEIMHGPTVTEAELHLMRSVGTVIRKGHVQHIAADRMELVGGTHNMPTGTLYVDCTARALGHSNTYPIFTPERIGLQMIRLYQPMFSAALLARLEATLPDDNAKNALAAPVPMTDTVASWVHSQIISMMNQYQWAQDKELRKWIAGCRLDGFGRPVREVDTSLPEYRAVLDQIKTLSFPAVANAQKLLAAA